MEAKKTEPVPEKPKKPFKLCFAPRNLIGRSHIQIGKPLTLPTAVLAPKFYSTNEVNPNFTNEEIEKQMKYLKVEGPREKYEDPRTENQRYGWYQEKFTNLDRSDRRLHFAKQINPLIIEHLMNYANIR